jgi:phage regulator Rha-like protein
MAALLMIPAEQIEGVILFVRGQKVILDANLAALYGTTTKNLNKAVKRNRGRFPDDFMFQLSEEEFASLRFQTGTSKSRGGRRYAPYAFTEHGALMIANLLNTKHAVEVSVFVVRAFVKLRELVANHKEMALKLAELERRVVRHDATLRELVVAIRQLMAPPPEPKREKFGFARE